MPVAASSVVLAPVPPSPDRGTLPAAALPVPVASATSGSATTLPRSGSAVPATSAGVPYGKDCPLWMVVGASGSSAERNACHTWVPAAVPYRARASMSASAEAISPPPPPPKNPPTTAAVATTSVTFHGSGPSRCPVAGYSPGNDNVATGCAM